MDVFLSASMVLFHVFRASAESNAPGIGRRGRVTFMRHRLRASGRENRKVIPCQRDLLMRWWQKLRSALANTIVAIALFALLDRFKQRT